jgi:plastocyanin
MNRQGGDMKRYWTLCIAAGMAAALAAPAVSQAQTTITLEDTNTFNPPSATLDLGAGSFDWEWGAGGVGTLDLHNVVQDDGLFSSGDAVRNEPDGFSVTASAGAYPYYCVIHLGMEGDVSVRPVSGTATKKGARVTWATDTTTTGNRYDVRYKDGKKWKPWRKKTSKLSATFGRKGKPVKLKKRVKLQARSRAGKSRSDWSPTLVLNP